MRYLAVWLPHFAWQALRQPNAGVQVATEQEGLEMLIVAASPGARQLGIRAGESLAQALLRAPECHIMPRSAVAEQQLAGWVLAALEQSSDRCAILAPERWLLDLDGMETCLGPAPEIARQVAARLRERGLEPRLGLAPTRTAALLAAHAALPPIAAGDGARALAALPLEALAALDGCSVDVAACLDLFARWGLRTLGEVQKLPRRALAERLGRAGLTCQGWARGEDRGLLLPAAAPPPPEEQQASFEPALDGYLPLLPWLEQQVRRQAAVWERGDHALASLTLALDLEGGRGWSWRYAPPLPHREARRCLLQLETALALAPPAAPITGATLQYRLLRPRRTQGGLFGDAAVEEESRERLLTRLRVLLDDPEGQRCGSPRLRDLHRSDQFTVVGSQFSVASCQLPVGAVAPATAGKRAEGRPALRACRPPAPVRITLPPLPTANDGLSLAGAMCHLPRQPAQRVRRAWGPWRGSGQWWRDDAWNREEWDAELASGRRVRLLYDRRGWDRRARGWFLLGHYD